MQKNQTSFISALKFRYLPYWPLFAVLLIVFTVLAYFYIQVTPPSYNVTATMSIKDERKGVEDSKLLEDLNINNQKTIVENETEVLHSRKLMSDVVLTLGLYAPVSEKHRYYESSAYTISPIIIQAQDPDKIVDRKVAIPFTYNKNNGGQVTIGKTVYPLHQWLKTPYGVLKFENNDKQTSQPTGPLSFMLQNPTRLANVMVTGLVVSASSKSSTIIDLDYKDEVPQRGIDVLNTLIVSYNKASVSEKNKIAATTIAFLDDRLRSLEGELKDIEARVEQFRATKGVVDLSEQGKVYLENTGANDQKIADINVQLSVLDQVEKTATANDGRIGIIPGTSGMEDPALTSMIENLNTLELEYEKQKTVTGENNPILGGIRDRIAKLRPDILQNIATKRKGLIASRANLSSTNNSYNSTLQAIPQKEKEYIEISRQQSVKNSAYEFLLQKREETALTYASAVADSRVVDPAQADDFPESPKKSFAFLAAFAAALGLGIGIVTLKELFSSKVLFRTDIEDHVDIPIAGELANVKMAQPIAINSPNNHYISEQFRHLRASIGLFSNKELRKKILVTSSIAGEGKSFVSSNLAVSLAATRKKVVLVDLDLRNPKASELFELGKETGVVNFLEDECTIEDIIVQSAYKNLSVIPVGIVNADPTELLLDNRLNDLFAYLESNYDYIIVDTAPVDPVADAYLLTEYCDMTLFVVRHGYTPKSMIQSLEQSGKMSELKNPVIVFNSVKGRGFFNAANKPAYGYNYGNSVYARKAIGDKKEG